MNTYTRARPRTATFWAMVGAGWRLDRRHVKIRLDPSGTCRLAILVGEETMTPEVLARVRARYSVQGEGPQWLLLAEQAGTGRDDALVACLARVREVLDGKGTHAA